MQREFATYFSSYPRGNKRIIFFSFFGYHLRKAGIKLSILAIHAASGEHEQRSESSMLDWQDTLIILFLLLFFIYFVWFAKLLVNISFCGWVENPYVKKCDCTCLPKTTRTDISSSLIRFICSLLGKCFTTQRLQLRFYTDIFAKFS